MKMTFSLIFEKKKRKEKNHKLSYKNNENTSKLFVLKNIKFAKGGVN